MSEQKICKDDKELDLQAYKSKKLNELVLEKAYGGYEVKMEAGRLVHFKYWVSKKL
jgi:predicted 2-oxoglutarate/Fe(II)-dependent dioxygenase YbiX